MLIHPWDAALDADEWKDWLATTDRFGMLVVGNLDPGKAPLALPTHFTVAGDELLFHLARPNPVWAHLEAASEVRLAVIGDYAYIPSYWRAKAGGPDEDGVPSSYYTAVQFVCRPTVVDEPEGKVTILRTQLGDLQPEGEHAEVGVDIEPYGRMLSGIRGVRLTVLRVDAKFKYDDSNPVDHRERVIGYLEERGRGLDAGAAKQQRRRLAAIGELADAPESAMTEGRRPDKHDPSTLAFATMSVHVGNALDVGTGALRTPLVMANSYLLPYDPSTMDWSSAEGLVYTRNSGANQVRLEQKLAALEGGEDAVAFATGVAALHGVFFTHLKSGDHVVVSDVTYEAVWRLFDHLLPEKYGIEATFVDISDLDAVGHAVRPNTKLVHVETIANPTTKVADIAALAGIAHGAGALLSVDSTCTPPPFYRPLQDGADLVVHSLTKYINGHGDAMGGVVIGTGELVRPIRADAMVEVGGVISPFNAWLIMRGSVTLPLRLRQQFASAEKVAAFLETDHRVAFVAYPGLTSHPQHQLARRQFSGAGYGAMMAFAMNGDRDAQNRFVDGLRIVASAVSLGHDESLIVHVGATGRGGSEYYPEPFRRYGHLRLSVGLEEADDLVADIRAALDATFPP